jgi:thiamine biosynthesis lipoprotein
MQRAGYRSTHVGSLDPHAGSGCAEIAVDTVGSAVTLPPGVGLDAGGIGKGLAADIVVEELMAMGATGALVNVGGDLRLAGDPPTPDGWTVAIEDPFSAGHHTAVVRVADGGVATTTPDHRRWRGASGQRRHVIDPKTGEPATTDVSSATVIAATGWMAEALAKAATLATSTAAVDLIDEAGAAGIVVSDSRKLTISSRMGEFL